MFFWISVFRISSSNHSKGIFIETIWNLKFLTNFSIILITRELEILMNLILPLLISPNICYYTGLGLSMAPRKYLRINKKWFRKFYNEIYLVCKRYIEKFIYFFFETSLSLVFSELSYSIFNDFLKTNPIFSYRNPELFQHLLRYTIGPI